MTQRDTVRASLQAEDGREHHHDVYRHRGSMAHGPVIEVKQAPMRTAKVRKLRTSRKRRKW